MAEDWTYIEVELIIEDYFSMLKDELTGAPINKSVHRRTILPLLNNRSEGSIEFKYQNISAVLSKLGVPWIIGYKPRWNYQLILETKVADYLRKNLSFESNFKEFAESEVIVETNRMLDFNNIIAEPPEPNWVMEPAEVYGSPVRVNYLEIEQNNKHLGDRGEEIVIKYEKWRLLNSGQDKLADQIEWVSQTRGDWAGFDILSKNENGTDRFIEVKTTKLSKDAPIFFSKNEYNFSLRNRDNFFLYRVFNFNKKPKLFIKNGQFDNFCTIEPFKYKGHF